MMIPLFKHKKKGSLLIELLLGTSLASMMFLMLYQAYTSLNKSAQSIRNTSRMEVQKSIFAFHAQQDIMAMFFPQDTKILYTAINKLTEKKENKKSEAKSQDSQQSEEENSTNEKKEKENKKQEKIFNEYKKYFPVLKKTEKKITASFVSTRQLLTKNNNQKECVVTYSFEHNPIAGLNSQVYCLKRYEEKIDNQKTDKDKKRGYSLIEYVEDPSIHFIYGIVGENKKDHEGEINKPSEEKEEEKSIFDGWLKNPNFEVCDSYAIEEPKDFLKKSFPYCVIFQGVAISRDGKKKSPFLYVFSSVSSQFSMYMNCNYKKLLKIKEEKEDGEKQEIKKDDKKISPQTESQNNNESNTPIEQEGPAHEL
jgi:hypothetical protein